MTVYDPYASEMSGQPANLEKSATTCCLLRPSHQTSLSNQMEKERGASVGSLQNENQTLDAVSGPASFEFPKNGERQGKSVESARVDSPLQPQHRSERDDAHHGRQTIREYASPDSECKRSTDDYVAIPETALGPPCPPDIEEIDLYMPSVEHRWFTLRDDSEDPDVFNTGIVTLDKDSIRFDRMWSRRPTKSPKYAAKACGYSCKLRGINRTSFSKGLRADHMAPANRGNGVKVEN